MTGTIDALAAPTLKHVRDLWWDDTFTEFLVETLRPRPGNLAVQRYVDPPQFEALAAQARTLGFAHAACGPLVRSSYHADQQAHAAGV